MNKLDVQPGRVYVTCNDKTAYIRGKNIYGLEGVVSGQGLKTYEWFRNAENIGDTDLDLIEEAKIEIIDPERFEFWKAECMNLDYGELLWACTIQWARLIEQAIREKGSFVPHVSAKEAGLFEHHNGELAITILFQCWEYGEYLLSIKDYRTHCTL